MSLCLLYEFCSTMYLTAFVSSSSLLLLRKVSTKIDSGPTIVKKMIDGQGKTHTEYALGKSDFAWLSKRLITADTFR